MGLIGSVRAVWVAMVSSGLSVHKARRHARSRLLAALLGLFVSLAAIGDSSSITVADGEVTITDTNPQTLNFPVSVTGDSTYDRYISFATADGTAAAGTDYTTSSGVFKLAAGANSGNIPVTVAGKSGSGTLPDKTFALNLDGAVGTAAAPAFSVNPAVSGTQGSASVVSLDINGDGKPDLVSNNSAFNVIAMLNTSAPGAATPTYAAPQQISTIDFGKFAVGDADNDGKPDLLVTDTSNSQLVLLRNTTATGSPTASFSAVAASLPIGTSSGATILAPLLTDMDNDGRPDAVMVNPNDQQVRVFRNTTSAGGAVSFGAAELYGISIVAPVLTAGDFNNDGKLDLAVGNGELLSTTAAQVLFNQGGATLLGAAQNISFGSGNHNADGIATGDFNHDGKLDLVLSDRGSDLPQVLLNTTAIGGNSFSFTAHSAGGPVMKSPDTLVVADYNGDGLPDLAVSDRDGPSNGNKGLIVFQNITAPGASSTRFVQLAGADLSFSFPGPLTLTDFNTDGKPDLAAVNSTSVGGPAVDVLANITLAPTATLAFSAVTDFFSTVRSRGTTAADFNRDGKPDLLTAGFGSSGVNLNTTAVGASTPSFAAPQTLGIPSYDSNSNTAADINGDGVADFIGANSLANQVAVQLNTTASGSGTISTGTAQSFAVGVTPRAPAAADLNGDGRPDLVVPNLSSNTVSVLLNATPPGDAASTTPSFTAQQTYATGTAPTKVALGDANGDGKPDLIVLNIGDHTVSVLLNAVPTGAATLNASSFSAQQAYAVGVDPRDVTTADVNGDGKPDLIVTNSNDGSVSVLLNALTPGDSTLNGNSFAAQQAFTANPGAFGVVAADLDGDGKPDLAVVNAANNGTFSILRNTTPTGSAALDANSFSAPFTVAMAGTGVFQSLAAADFNRDGKPDLAAAGANLEILSVVLNTQYAASLSSTSATGTIHYDLPVPITANPTALSFASRAVGETSATQFVTLTNSSGNQLALSIPTGAGDFAVDNTPADRCGTALNGGGASCRVYLRFTPSATGSRTATLSINSGAIDIALSGAGEARNPQLSFVPDAGGSASVPFGNQPVNMQSTPQSVEIRNSGNVPLNLSTTAGGNDPTTFTLDPSRTCGATLAVNASCTYAWRFTPTAVRVFTAATTINASDTGGSNAAAPPLTADLLGAGIGAIASLAPASLDFGNIPVGNSSTNQLFTLENTGDATLTITSILSDSSEFEILGNGCGAPMSLGGTCSFFVRFVPNATGARSGTVSVISNGGNPTSDLSGTGTATDATIVDPPPVTDAEPNQSYTSASITITGINVPTAISVTDGEYSINGGAFTAVAGTVQPDDAVRIRRNASPDFATQVSATLTVGSVSVSYHVTTRSAGTQADAFSFTPANDVSRNTVIVSNGISVSGIEIAVPIGIVGGEYSVNGGAYTSAAGTVNDGDSVTVRVTSSASFATAVTATLTVGQGGDAQSADFVVTTLDAITAPNPFGFGSRSDVALNSEQTSNDVSIDGINTDAPVSVTGGEYSIDGGAFTSADGTIAPGGQVRVRVTASSQFSTGATVTLNVGGVEGSFVVTTLAADTTPDAFGFGSIDDIPLNSVQTSNEVTITGLNTDAPISVSGGEYSIDGGSWTSAASTIAADASVRVRVTAAGTFSTPATATLDIGGVTADFTVTTLAAVTDPNAFSFGSVSDVPLNSVQTSAAVAITGINTGSPVSIVGGEYSIDDGPFTAVDGLINPDQTVAVRTTASGDFSTAVSVTLTVGSVTGTYTVTTLAEDTTPDGFSFNGVTGVNPSTEQTSDPVTITGINSAAAVTVTGGSYSIDGGPFTSAPGTITSGQQLRARTNASPGFDTTVQATVSVGGVSAQFNVTTRVPVRMPDAFSFTPQTDVALDSDIDSNPVAISGIEVAVPISIVGGQYSINGGAFTAVTGTILAGQSVVVRVHSDTALASTTTATLTVGDGGDAVAADFSVTTLTADTDPDAFSFTPVTGAEPNSLQASHAVTISGVNTAVSISVVGGAYSIDGGAFTVAAGTVNAGQLVRVQLTASGSFSSAAQATLTVGGVSADFTVTTRDANTTPVLFSFTPVTDAALDALVTSDAITVTGIEAPTAISVSGDTDAAFCIDGNPCTAMIGATVSAGQSVRLQVRSSPDFGTTTTATVDIGGVTADFDVTTLAEDTSPDPFSFTAVTGADPSTLQISDAITVAGINSPASVSVTGGRYSIDGGAFTASVGTVNAGSSVRVENTASPDFATTTTTTLDIAGVAADFDVTTRSADTQADAFSFTPANDVSRNTVIVSNGISVSGIEIAVPIGIVGGEYSVNGGAYTSAAGTVNDGDSVTVRVTSSESFAAAVTATLTVGQGGEARSADFVVTTLDAITAPNPFGFGSRSDVALNSEQTSNDVSIDGINTDAPVSVTGGEYSIDGGAFTSADGTIAPGGQVRVRVIASSQFSTGATVTLNVGGVEGSFVVTTLAADTTPDAFTFGSINDIPLNSVQTSNEATITGLNTDAPVSVSGGEYSIDGGSWTSAAGTIAADAAVRVRVTAAGMFSTPATATLDIGGVTADFTVTTLAAVTDPNAFSFGSVSDVPLNSVQTSGAVTITGINTGSPVSVVGGEYSIDNGPFTAADGLINPGQMIAVRTTASGDFSTAVTVIVTIGTVTGTYTVTTLSEDLTPDNFSFSGVTGVNPSTEQTSDPVTITGINSAAPVLVTGGSYSIDGGAFTSAPGTITSGQQLRARTNASPDYDTTVQAQIDVGGVSAGFSVTTRSADGAPDPFAFAPVTNAQLGRTYTSNSVTISGIDLPVAITIGGGNGSYSINGGAFTRAAGTVQAGDTVRAQVQAATSYGETRQVVVTVGNGAQAQSAMFRVSTADDDLSPNYLNFGSVADAPLGSTQTSRRVTISGITTAVPISISGGRYSIDGGEFTTGAGTISEGQTVVVEAIAASTYATTVTVQVTVGAARGEFTVTTLAEDANPDVLDFDVVPDALPGSVQTSVTLIVSGINVPTAIRVSGGEYAIGDGEFTHADGEIAPGETLTLRGIASMQFGATQTVTLTIGTITAHFTIVTAAADTDPDSFVLGTISGADPDSEQRSGVITIRGINTAAPVTISGGRYSINGGAFTSAPGTVEAGEEIVVAVTAASTSDTTVTATLSIGAVNAQFAVSTSTVLPPVEVEGRRGGGAMGPGWLLSLAALAFWRRRRPAGVLRRSGDAMR